MRVVVLVCLLMSVHAHAAELTVTKRVIALDDASGAVTKANLATRIPNVLPCVTTAGTLEVDLILTDGKPTTITVRGAPTPAVETCIRDAFKTKRWAAITGKIVARIELRVSEAVVKPIGVLDLTPAPGGHTAGDIHAVIVAKAASYRACYQSALKTQPALAGKFVYQITIADTGSVSTVRAQAQTKVSRKLDACIIGHLKKLKFPAKNKATVNYPMVFDQA